MAYLLKKQKI